MRSSGKRLEMRMIVACLVGALTAGGLCCMAAVPPQVIQPDSAEFGATERSSLLGQLAELETILASSLWGSGGWLGQGGWDPYQFALYVAGTLDQLGYGTAVVTSASWPSGARTWVLASLDLGGRLAWVPIEATPEPGSAHRNLGFVPRSSSNPQRFDERYATFDQVANLGPNKPPTAQIRPPMNTVLVGEPATFFALTSSDPDGRIILYQWRVDGGRTSSRAGTIHHYVFKAAGMHTVELIVVDDRGARASTGVRVEVYAEEPEDGGGSGCGCG